MSAPVHVAALAYAYAWWLTGDDNRAQAAVLAAAGSSPSQVGDLPALLRAVRAHAGAQPTMCPASEIALLHDGHGLALDVAADLAAIPAPEARTELAHGRLEALLETADDPFDHPERLGGLAVGNPPDTAHARTCSSCAEAQRLLRLGRDEVVALAPQPAPPELLERFPATSSPPTEPTSPPAAGTAAGTPDQVRASDTARTPEAARAATPAPSADPGLPRATAAQRRGTLLVAFVVTAAVLLVLLSALSGDGSGAGSAASIL